MDTSDANRDKLRRTRQWVLGGAAISFVTASLPMLVFAFGDVHGSSWSEQVVIVLLPLALLGLPAGTIIGGRQLARLGSGRSRLLTLTSMATWIVTWIFWLFACYALVWVVGFWNGIAHA